MKYKILYNERCDRYRIKYKLRYWPFWLGVCYADEFAGPAMYKSLEEAKGKIKKFQEEDEKEGKWNTVLEIE